MSDLGFEFGSPSERQSTVFLQHVAGFEATDISGGMAFITPDALEKDSDAHPITLRGVLRGEHGEVSSLSAEFLLRNLIIPNLPVGFYGDEDGPPVILGAAIEIQEPGQSEDPLEYAKGRLNTVKIKIVPTLGKLSRISCVRDPQLGGYGIDWFIAERGACRMSLFGGILDVIVRYDQNE